MKSTEKIENIVYHIISDSAYLLVNKKLIYTFGLEPAVFLSNLINKYFYFKDKNQLKNNSWFYLVHEQQINEIGISLLKLRKCKVQLKEFGVIDTKMIGVPAKEYYKIDFNILFELLTENPVQQPFYNINNTENSTSSYIGNGRACPTENSIANNNNKAINNNKINNNKVAKKQQYIRATNKITPKQFDSFWQIYPKKIDKGKALSTWNKICTRKNIEPPTFEEIKIAIEQQIKTDRWKDKTYIPHPTTWLNQQRWLDDPVEMKSFNYKTELKTGYIGPSEIEYKKAKIV